MCNINSLMGRILTALAEDIRTSFGFGKLLCKSYLSSLSSAEALWVKNKP